MRYESVDRLPVFALEPFEQAAVARWRSEGLPDGAHPVEFLGMSKLIQVPLAWGPIPAFEQKVNSEDEDYVVEVANMGGTIRRRKDNPSMFHGHIDHPVRTREDAAVAIPVEVGWGIGHLRASFGRTSVAPLSGGSNPGRLECERP